MTQPDDPQRPWLAAYAPGVPADIDPPDLALAALLERSVERFPDRPALDFLGAGTTYRELGDAVRRVAGALHRLGVRAGDRVALVLPNCPQHVVAFFATLRLGAIVVEHNPLYTSDELAVQFADHGARVAVCWSAAAGTVAKLGPERVISVDVAGALPRSRQLALRLPLPAARSARRALGPRRPPGGTIGWDGLTSGAPLPADHPHPALTDVAALQYTGGTTGTPKGAVLTHANLAANAAQSRAWASDLVEGEETFLAVLPMFHAYGLTLCLITAVSIAARVVLLPRFELEQTLAAIRRTRPTFLPAVPPIYRQLAETAPERGVDLSSIRYALSGAMPLPADLVQLWESVAGNLLIEGYGMTETSPICVGNPVSPGRRAGYIGVPYPSTRVRVADPDDPGSDVSAGDPGELLVQGPQVFAGYWNRPEETAASLLPGGWVRTGDIVQMESDGFIRLVDRVKDLIIVGGFNVYPSEVEQVMRRHPDVQDVSVVGLPGGGGGDQVAAAVIPCEGARPDQEALREFCRAHLAAYKIPRRIVLVDELPRSLIGKALRRKVRDQLLAVPG